MLDWLNTLSPGAASFVGSLTGASVGLIALLFGALFNARLNRNRDDRLRSEDARAVAAALRAELAGLHRTLVENAKLLKDPQGGFLQPDLAHSVRVLPHMLSRMGLLDVDTIRAVIDANILVEQYCEKLIMMGGQLQQQMPSHRRLVLMPSDKAPDVAAMNEGIAGEIQKAIVKLDAYLI